MKRILLFAALVVSLIFYVSKSSAQGYWDLRSGKLYKLDTESESTKHMLIRDSETDVIFESKNSTFKRPDASGKYENLPLGYEVFFRHTWMSPKHQLVPGEWVTNKLGVHLTESSINPQDVNISGSSRIIFVDASKNLNSPGYQIPYSTLYKWVDIDNDANTGPSVSWSDGDRSKHQAEMTVTGKVPSNSNGQQTQLGLVIRISDYAYWMYTYHWENGQSVQAENISGASSIGAYGSIDGVYSSDFNELTITRNGNRVTGTYKYRNGKIEGTLNGNVLTGTWTQDNGKGKIRFVFAEDGNSFDGKWDYNDAEPTSKWNGKKISGVNQGDFSKANQNSFELGTYSSDFNELTMWKNGNKVSGTYKYRDGKVEGILNGNVLTGTWTQNNGKGKIRFVFSPDGSSFEGKWGYNDSEPTSKWNGKRL